MSTNHEYTPSTEEVRLNYAYLGGTVGEREFDRRTESFDRWYAAEFGRIIAAAEQRGKEQGWDEGYQDGHNDGLSDGHPLGNMRDPNENPYRADREGVND